MRNYTTQMDAAKQGIITDEVRALRDRFELPARVQIILDHFAPLLFDLNACCGITVSRQIYEIKSIIDIIIIDRLRFSGHRARSRIGFPIHQCIDQRRFSNIALSCKCKLRQFIVRQFARNTAYCLKVYRFDDHKRPLLICYYYFHRHRAKVPYTNFASAQYAEAKSFISS